jgi:translation elongation factor EF-4
MLHGDSTRIDWPAQLPDVKTIFTRFANRDELANHHADRFLRRGHGTAVTKRRGIYTEQDYPSPNRVQLSSRFPYPSILVNFFDN